MSTRTPRLGSVNAIERALIAVTAALTAVGVVCVGTAITPETAGGESVWSFMLHDAALVALGAVCFVVACRVPLARLSRLAPGLLVVTLVLLVAVRVVGSVAAGGDRWLGYGNFSFQPSELFTLAACFYLAVAVARAERTGRQWLDVLKPVVPVLVGAGLILLEPDMGTASVVVIVTFGVLVVAGLPRRVIGLGVGLLGVGLLLAAEAAPYRWARLMAVLHPGSAPSASTYQVIEAKIALGAGQVHGLGFGQSPAKWGLLPNAHTDFIFAVVGQEFGFIGSVLVLGLFVALISLGFSTARHSSDRVGQLLATGITLWFAVETLVNVASVVGWWPVTGIPLPLISYGGTSLVIDLVALGLLVNVARRADGPHPVEREPARAGAVRGL